MHKRYICFLTEVELQLLKNDGNSVEMSVCLFLSELLEFCDEKFIFNLCLFYASIRRRHVKPYSFQFNTILVSIIYIDDESV